MEKRTLAYRFRLMPTPLQEQMFSQILGCCRLVYNKALEAHQAAYAREGVTLSGFDLIQELPGWKKEHPFLKIPPAQALQAAISDLAEGWSSFFEEKTDRPTWRKYGSENGFRLPTPKHFKIKRHATLKKRERFLYIPKMGMSGTLGPIKMVQHRPIDGKIKNLTIKREGQMWFASFITQKMIKSAEATSSSIFAMDAGTKVLSDDIKVLGVDRGVRRPVATSDGAFLGTSILTPELQLKQAHLARAVSRKQEALRAKHGIKPGGSLKGIQQPNALLRAKLRLAKFLGKMARKRKDQAHKISRALVNSADVIVFEALETKKMTSTKNKKSSRRLRRDILDISWAQIESFTNYKAQWADKMTVRVEPAYTSQTCSICGYQHPLNRKGDMFLCRSCGHKDDADINASKNIRRLGLVEIKRQEQERLKEREQTEKAQAIVSVAKPKKPRSKKSEVEDKDKVKVNVKGKGKNNDTVEGMNKDNGRVDAASLVLEGADNAPMKDKSSLKSKGVRVFANEKPARSTGLGSPRL